MTQKIAACVASKEYIRENVKVGHMDHMKYP
jgi:hypothetical protein